MKKRKPYILNVVCIYMEENNLKKHAKKNQRRSKNNQKSFEKKYCNKQPKFIKYPMFALETSKEIHSAKKICREQHPTV